MRASGRPVAISLSLLVTLAMSSARAGAQASTGTQQGAVGVTAAPGTAERRVLQAARAAANLHVDGRLDEAAW